MLTHYRIKNLTVFQNENLEFSPHLNIVIGENGTGKSHLMKTAYAIMAASAEQGKKSNNERPTKSSMQKLYADKFVHVLRPENLGRLARRKQGRERCELEFIFDDPALNSKLTFSTNSKSEVVIETLPSAWQNKPPVFIPTRELMTLYPGFVSLYESRYLEFDESYRDTCLLLGEPTLRGTKEKKASQLLAPLEEAIGGHVILDKNGRFYLKIPGQGTMEMPLVAEGLRKIAMIIRLISNGTLLDKGTLFWDEPEANLNPRLIRLIAKSILELSNHGIQVFIATHSLFLLREIEVLLNSPSFKNIAPHYFSLAQTENGVTVEQGQNIEDLQTLVLLDEALEQSDRFLEAEALKND